MSSKARHTSSSGRGVVKNLFLIFLIALQTASLASAHSRVAAKSGSFYIGQQFELEQDIFLRDGQGALNSANYFSRGRRLSGSLTKRNGQSFCGIEIASDGRGFPDDLTKGRFHILSASVKPYKIIAISAHGAPIFRGYLAKGGSISFGIACGKVHNGVFKLSPAATTLPALKQNFKGLIEVKKVGSKVLVAGRD